MLPPQRRERRADAGLVVLDISEFFGETSGGVKTYLREKARYVGERAELRHVIVVPGARNEVVEESGVRWYRLRGPQIPLNSPYRAMLAFTTLSRIIAAERPDVIEIGSHYLAPWVASRAGRRLGVPVVFFCHSHLPSVLAPHGARSPRARRWAARLAEGYLRRLAANCAATLAPSDATRRSLDAAGFTNVRAVSLGVDLDRFHPRRQEGRDETRRRLRLPDGPLALYVGRFAREKELDVLLAAWPAVERETKAHLLLVGDGTPRAWLSTPTRAERILWRGYESDRDRLADLMAACDLYVSPCSIETFGLAAVEAFASGTPVLSADHGAVAERVAASGAGALFEKGTASALARAACALLLGDRKQLGRRGRAYAERHHSWNTAFDEIFAIYHELHTPGVGAERRDLELGVDVAARGLAQPTWEVGTP